MEIKLFLQLGRLFLRYMFYYFACSFHFHKGINLNFVGQFIRQNSYIMQKTNENCKEKSMRLTISGWVVPICSKNNLNHKCFLFCFEFVVDAVCLYHILLLICLLSCRTQEEKKNETIPLKAPKKIYPTCVIGLRDVTKMNDLGLSWMALQYA